MTRGRSDVWPVVIGVFKLVKALLLVVIAAGASEILRRGTGQPVYDVLMLLPVDPRGRAAYWVAREFAALTPHRVLLVAIGAAVYAALFLVEAIGLLLRKRWGEIVTVVITASFIPLEIYEAVRGASGAKVVVIVINLAVVGYLLWRLRTNKRR